MTQILTPVDGTARYASVVSADVCSQARPMGALTTSAPGALGTLPIRFAAPTAPERANLGSL